jgi:hypothetical protein
MKQSLYLIEHHTRKRYGKCRNSYSDAVPNLNLTPKRRIKRPRQYMEMGLQRTLASTENRTPAVKTMYWCCTEITFSYTIFYDTYSITLLRNQ